MLTRRRFLVASGTTFVALSLRAQGIDAVPAILDHILLGCSDLEEGIAFVESHTGVRAAFGGVHPGRGTQNALLSLGERHYLEIIAPDPKQEMPHNIERGAAPSLHSELKARKAPRLVGWAAHPGDLAAFAKRLQEARVTFTGPTPGSRKRPDGHVLQWQTLNLNDDDSGLLPFFIEWSAGSPHPSSDAPHGCHVDLFELAVPDLDKLKKKLAILELNVAVAQAVSPQIRVRIAGPKGELQITS